jgi:uncharacterized membrane protein
MNILEILLILPIAGIAFCYLKIKQALRRKGYDVNTTLSLVSDYYKFKRLTEAETDEDEKKKYKAILFELHFSFALFVLVLFIGMILR